ncbi:hypothetical protein MM300_19370 [Evansella sp. LMS18]|jgi:hypothetical protein|uniref:hypothetical protein n=1 Tax=Evansella sp. LMS18 TaxID=2924033 RepID=UPI0020D17E04|nr:hypothetical protein [Evansella sp. LMS18]UTR10014.1 hypothetical protein MM300_19370 [Evansella sp. LMS18]
MLSKNWLAWTLNTILILAILGGCAFADNENDQGEADSGGNASGIMLAGEEPPEVSGTVKSIESEDEIIITVNGVDKVYRLSEDAKNQLKDSVIEEGSEVTFTVYTIGDDKETIGEFKTD